MFDLVVGRPETELAPGAALEQQRDTLEVWTGSLAASPIWHDVVHGVGYKPASVLDEES